MPAQSRKLSKLKAGTAVLVFLRKNGKCIRILRLENIDEIELSTLILSPEASGKTA